MKIWTEAEYNKIIEKQKKKADKEQARYNRRHQKLVNENNAFIINRITARVLGGVDFYFVDNSYRNVFNQEQILDQIKKQFPFLYFKYEETKLVAQFKWKKEPFEN